MKNFPPFFFLQNQLFNHTNCFSPAIKSPLSGYIQYATTEVAPSRYEFCTSLWFLLYSCPTVSQFADPFNCLKRLRVCRSLQMQMQQSNSAAVLCLLISLAFLIIAIAGETYFDRSLFMSDISTVSTGKQIGLKEIDTWKY